MEGAYPLSKSAISTAAHADSLKSLLGEGRGGGEGGGGRRKGREPVCLCWSRRERTPLGFVLLRARARERERERESFIPQDIIDTRIDRHARMQGVGVKMSGRHSSFLAGGRRPCEGTRPMRARDARAGRLACSASLKDVRDRISSVKNTQKITDAMKLVAAAKVRRAQDAVISGRPFASNLVQTLYGVNQRLKGEGEVDSPLIEVKPVKKVLLVTFTGDRGLCGGFNTFVIKRTEQRVAELKAAGVDAELIVVGKKGAQYFKRRSDEYEIVRTFETGQAPTVKESQAVADVIYSKFVGDECQKVELIYTKFISLIASDPIVQTLLPMSPEGEVCDIDGNCLDAADDELFKLTTKDGDVSVERSSDDLTADGELSEMLIFEQEPQQILDAIFPLYMNSTVLRALQESLASELAARMNAMNSASDNAKELKKNLTLIYNRGRQAKITGEIIEIVAGSQ